tara:strand:+ start:2557 stop:4458 length:1902 start_codon:yes stop_codon:yes gene_type:complete
MVYSNIDKSINYKESKKLDNDDMNYDAALYKMELFDNEIIIALGQPKYKYIEKSIVYYLIYIIKNDKVISQIGLYEMNSDRIPTLLDEDGDVRLELTGSPILYSFVDEEFITNKRNIKEKDKKDKKDKSKENSLGYSPLKEQTEKDSKKEKKGFKSSKSLPWIQNFMKNINYDIMQTEPNGNCFFESVVNGLKTIGIDKSIEDLRKILADKYDKEVFIQYRQQFTDVSEVILNLKSERKDLAKKHKIKKQELAETKDRTQQKNIIANAKTIQERDKEAKQELITAENYLSEFKFMKGIDTMEAFKAVVQTNSYWGDDSAIVILEKELNIKFILFSKFAFENKDFDNVLQCGRKETDDDFNPTHYIILSYNGNHYETISYKLRTALAFVEIPYDVKELIFNTCFENSFSSYTVIPEFRNAFQTKFNIDAQGIYLDELPEISNPNKLYDSYTSFTIGPRQLDSKPGTNNTESLGPEGIKPYIQLAAKKNWRKLLSNSAESKLNLDNKSWNSVDHYYNASKFAKNNKEFYNNFSLDSNSELSKNVNLAIIGGSKTGIYKNKKIRDDKIIIDRDFFDGRHNEVMKKALHAKFTQNPELSQILLRTKNAKINNYVDGKKPEVNYNLMELRSSLQNKHL